MEPEKNSFAACWQGCALQLGHRAFILCSSNFITYLIFFLYRPWLMYRKTFLIKIYCVCLEKVSKHKGKALILKGYFARTPHCIQGISRISKAWDKIQPNAGTCTCINNARLPHSRDPHVPGDSTIPAVLFGKSSPCFWEACHWQ